MAGRVMRFLRTPTARLFNHDSGSKSRRMLVAPDEADFGEEDDFLKRTSDAQRMLFNQPDDDVRLLFLM
jgi:hypothetical protein